MIFEMFASYYSCKKELLNLENRREDFFYSLPGTTVPGISYEPKVGTTAAIEGKYSIISDELVEWDEKQKPLIKYCNQVVSMCDFWIDEMNDKTKEIFKYRYTENKTLDEISVITGYDHSWIARIIRRECSKIKEAKFG